MPAVAKARAIPTGSEYASVKPNHRRHPLAFFHPRANWPSPGSWPQVCKDPSASSRPLYGPIGKEGGGTRRTSSETVGTGRPRRSGAT